MKVLIADDVGFIRRRVQVLLTERGYDVVMAENGQEGLQQLRHDHTIQAIITDYYMPEMDGLEFFKQAQQLDRMTDQGRAEPPSFILMTASRSDTLIPGTKENLYQYAQNIGFLDVLSKPMDTNRLICLLEAIKIGSADDHDCAESCQLGDGAPFVPEEVEEVLVSLQKLIGIMIDDSQVEAMMQLYDELDGHVGRLHDALEMFAVESG